MWKSIAAGSVLCGALMTLSLPTEAAAPPRAPAISSPAALASAYQQADAAMRAAGWATAGRHFVLFDPAGDGYAIEVVGDLATADRIAVLVPGTDTTLANFDRGLGGVARRAPAVQARTLYSELSRVDSHPAVVAWLGYDPPNGLGLDAVHEAVARAGAKALAAFVDDLATLRPAARITLIGHSYGSIVVGLASRALARTVENLIVLGSPGMGVHTASDLGGQRVWAAEAPNDWIRRVPGVRIGDLGHDTRPSDPDFGAISLPTGGVEGHDGYLVPGTETLRAVTAIVSSGVTFDGNGRE